MPQFRQLAETPKPYGTDRAAPPPDPAADTRDGTHGPAGSDGPPEPLTATVPREFVHRAAVAETLLTGWSGTGEDRFTVSAQWPRAHQLHVSPDRTSYDPLLLAETVRQCGALLAHTEYGVPLGHRFVLHELRLTASPERLAVGPLPAEPVVGVTVTEVRRRGGRPAAMRYDADVRLDGDRVATGYVDVSWTGENVYRRLRGGRTPDSVTALAVPPGLSPAAVGRAVPEDVVLAPTRRRDRWQLRVDTGHPVFFDHPLDHVPGMLLLEAARQAAQVRRLASRPPVALRAVFCRYAELDRPVWIQATEEGNEHIQVVAIQGESAVFECRVSTGGL